MRDDVAAITVSCWQRLGFPGQHVRSIFDEALIFRSQVDQRANLPWSAGL